MPSLALVVRSLRLWQTVFGLGAVALIGVAAWQAWWPFHASPRPLGHYAKPTIWQFLFSDRVTLGFARAMVVALALYVAASVPALIAAGRWLRGFGASGLTADDAQDARKTIVALEEKLGQTTAQLRRATEQTERLRSERNRLRTIITTVMRDLTQTSTRSTTSRTVGEGGHEEANEHPGAAEDPDDAGAD